MQSLAMSPSLDGLLADATALRTAVIADGFVVKLFKVGLNPNRDTLPAAFDAVEADFAGYASVALGGAGKLFDPVSVDSQGRVGFSSASAFFQRAGGAVDNEIGGFWVEKTAGDVYRYGLFPQPILIDADLRFVDMNFYLTPDGQDYVDVSS